MRHYYTVFL